MIWQRQSDETSKAYRAFCVYRDAGPNRSLQKVSHELSKSVPLLKRWSRRHRWVERVAALEDYEEEIRCEASEAVRREAAIDLAQRENDLRERVMENEERAVLIESTLLDRFERMLEELPLVQCEEIVDRDGIPVKCIFKPAVPDAVLAVKRLHEIATRSLPATLELESRGQPYGLTDEDRAELQALAGDPRLGELFMRLFSIESWPDVEDGGSNPE